MEKNLPFVGFIRGYERNSFSFSLEKYSHISLTLRRMVISQKNIQKLFILLVLVLAAECSFGQFNENQSKKKQKLNNDFWTIRNTAFQLGFHALDDDDTPYEYLTDYRRWSWIPLPTKVSITKELWNDLKIEGALYGTRLKKNLPKNKYLPPYLYFGADINLRYMINFFKEDPNRVYYSYKKHYIDTDFRRTLRDMSIDIYPILGVGFHYRTQRVYTMNFSVNLGLGFDWWLVEDKWAINLQSMAKFGFRVPLIETNSNILHHSAGVVYFYNKRVLRKKKIKYEGF